MENEGVISKDRRQRGQQIVDLEEEDTAIYSQNEKEKQVKPMLS